MKKIPAWYLQAFPTDNTTALPLPPGVQELPVRKCAFDEDEAVTVAATNELAPTVGVFCAFGFGLLVPLRVLRCRTAVVHNGVFQVRTVEC